MQHTHRPVITAEEWEHILFVRPDCVCVAKGANGYVWGYTGDVEFDWYRNIWISKTHAGTNLFLILGLTEKFKDFSIQDSKEVAPDARLD